MKNLKFAHFGLLVLVALSIFTASCEDNPVEITCADLDYTVLRTLYLSTDGDNWTNNSGWPTAAEFEANTTIPAGTDLSTWYGINTNLDGCVDDVSLGLNNLSGNIPPEIGSLVNLNNLELRGNQLIGSIPPEIGNLSDLSALALAGNQLSGTIPPELGSMPTLGGLDLSSNQLIGSIPPEIGSSSLALLIINNNQLSGCYDSNLNSLCGQLVFPPLFTNTQISDGNNFDAPWDDFCATGAGACTP